MSEDEKQAKVGQKKFSDFASVTGEGIEGVGLKNGQNVRFELTTDSVKVNPNPFRNAKGQFIGTPEELDALKNQRDVNEFLYNAISDIEGGEIDLEGYATEDQLFKVGAASIERDEKLQEQIDTNKVESESGDKHLQVEIEEIALALETLLVQREHGQWKYIGFTGDTIPRNAGEFGLAVSDIASSQDNIITLNQEDLKGITHGFADTEVGDYVEIVNTEDPTSYALFVVTKAPEGTGIVNVEVALKDTGYNIWVGETCEIRFFAVNDQNIALDDLDDRYLKLSGGTMDGAAKLAVNTLEPVNMPFIYYEGDPDNTHAAGLINRFMMNQYAVNKAGDTMTGILEAPRFNIKKDGEAVCLIEGKADGTATSARLTFSNKINANAYGNITWNGNSGQGWFQFNKDVDFSTKNLHSVNNIRLSGNKTIQESQTTRIQLDGKVIIRKAGTDKAGFVLKGGVDGNSDGNLLSVYHNASGLDSVDYYGKQEGENNLATVGYVDSKVGGGGGGSSASAKIQAGIQSWQASRLAEGCFNLLDESNSTTVNCKVARGLTYHTYQSYPDEWPWMLWALRSGGQIHLTDMNGKYLMSKPVLSVAKYDAGSGDNPEGALWFFKLSIYGFESETSLSGLYMVEFENCLEAG